VSGFVTVYGRRLVEELPVFVHPPYLVVTMDDLWPRFAAALQGPSLAGVHLVRSLDIDELESILPELPACASVIGLGGGLPGADRDDGECAVRSAGRVAP
jgi:hypothetical protein